MITREQVADLQPGDVVEITSGYWPAGSTIRGPLRIDRDGWLICADYPVRLDNGEPGGADRDELTLVERGPRLYVNHARGVPVPGDVVRDADSGDAKVWLHGRDYDDEPCWLDAWRMVNPVTNKMPRRLRLLVDGETGQVVQ